MLTRTYISKQNVIIKDSDINVGINPATEIVYGKNTTRLLLYFDTAHIKDMLEKGLMPYRERMTHKLKLTNAGSIDFTDLHTCKHSIISNDLKRRATSFDLIFFLIPKQWDGGKGFDYTRAIFNEDYYDTYQKDRNRLVSTDGCNWYQCRNGILWDEEGVYSNATLQREYDAYSSELGSEIVFSRQHFDVGNDDIDIDITEIVNKMLDGEIENNGIGIAFSPGLERLGEDKYASVAQVENYVAFFGPYTNKFFEPYVETNYCDYVADDRSNFVLNKRNRLYLYSTIGGKPSDLDELPTCTIKDGEEGNVFEDLEVGRQFRGVYYVELTMSSKEYEPDTMYYDVWSNIKYDGVELDDVELDFTTKTPHNYFNIDNTIHDEPEYTPSIAGINDDEDIYRNGEIRKVKVTARPSYTQNVMSLVDEMYYRMYVLDGEREITVIPYTHVDMAFNENYFYIDFNTLIPQKYYVDVRFKYNGEVRTFKDVLHFKVVSSLNNMFA